MGAFNNYVDKKEGRGGQQKVHACPPRGGGGGVSRCPRGQKFAKRYRRIMANDYKKSYYFTFYSALT